MLENILGIEQNNAFGYSRQEALNMVHRILKTQFLQGLIMVCLKTWGKGILMP